MNAEVRKIFELAGLDIVWCPVLAKYRMDYFLLDREAATARSAMAFRSSRRWSIQKYTLIVGTV
jgi:hypothetical protein